MKSGSVSHVIDATAGLGRDGFLLASLGAQVTLIERSATMHALLQEGMARAQETNTQLAEIIGRMHLIQGDAKDLLPELRPETRTQTSGAKMAAKGPANGWTAKTFPPDQWQINPL